MEDEISISWSDITAFVKKYFAFIVVITILAAGVSFGVSKYFIPEKFQTEVSMYVAPNANEQSRTASLSELNYAQAVVDTYIEILRTTSFMTDVITEANLNYTPDQLSNMISMQAQNGTEIFRISVTSTNPDEALLIANTIAELAPAKIIEIKDADAVRVVDPAQRPVQPSSPNVMRNTVLGLLVGLLLGVGIAFAIEFLDNRVKNEQDLTRSYPYPVLGVIPNNK